MSRLAWLELTDRKAAALAPKLQRIAADRAAAVGATRTPFAHPEGLAGMAFIENASKSGKAGAKWMKFQKL